MPSDVSAKKIKIIFLVEKYVNSMGSTVAKVISAKIIYFNC